MEGMREDVEACNGDKLCTLNTGKRYEQSSAYSSTVEDGEEMRKAKQKAEGKRQSKRPVLGAAG